MYLYLLNFFVFRVIISLFYFTYRVLGCIWRMERKPLHPRDMDGCSPSGSTNPIQTSATTQLQHLELESANNTATSTLQTSDVSTRASGFDGCGLGHGQKRQYACPAQVSQGARTYSALCANACRDMSRNSERGLQVIRDKDGFLYFLRGRGRTTLKGTRTFKCQDNFAHCPSRVLVYGCGRIIMCNSGAFAHSHPRRPNGLRFRRGPKRNSQYG